MNEVHYEIDDDEYVGYCDYCNWHVAEWSRNSAEDRLREHEKEHESRSK